MSTDLNSVKNELANYAENKNRRSLLKPYRWNPEQIENPTTGLPFSQEGAWNFIANKLRSGHEIEKIILDHPKGTEAYVLKVKIHHNKPALYIKIHFGNSKILGRSFHYSDPGEE